MQTPEHYEADLLFFFEGQPRALELYRALFALMEAEFPQARVQVQKSQISFYGRHLFAAVSLPRRKMAGHGDYCLLLTFGLGCEKRSPRIAVSTEPYPGRWTHHAPLAEEGELDAELLSWLREAFEFSETKRRRA